MVLQRGVGFIAGTEMSGRLASSLDSQFISRNSLSFHPSIDRLASSDILQLRIEASLRDRLIRLGEFW